MPAAIRLTLRSSVAAGVGVILLGAGGAWLVERAGSIHTSDARVRARMVAISADVAGRIVEIPVDAGDRIEAGATIVRLDDREARLAVSALELELRAIEAEIARETLRAGFARAKGSSRIDSREAQLAAARADVTATAALLQAAMAEHARTRALRDKGLVTQAAMDAADGRLEAARGAALRAAAGVTERAAGAVEAQAEAGEAAVIEAGVAALTLRGHALTQQLAAARLALEQHTVAAPAAGVVDEVFADAGEYVAAGARLALAHDDADVWIEANVKETEIARVMAGAHVEVHLDAAAAACSGAVTRIGSAATAEFALVPNANPTGVFTKITQRVPVRVVLGADCPPARPGAMAELKIATR